MGVAQFTTPTILLTFTEEGLDFTQADSVFVTFEQKGVKFTKTGTDLELDEKSIGVFLTQAETGKLEIGYLDVQANWMIDGERYSSEVGNIKITRQLLKEVIS